MMMMGIGMPISQAKAPFMGSLRLVSGEATHGAGNGFPALAPGMVTVAPCGLAQPAAMMTESRGRAWT